MFAKTFGCVRFIYNHMLSDKIKYYEETKQKLNNTPAQYKSEYEWLKEVDSLALANAQMNLQTAYNNFFRSSSPRNQTTEATGQTVPITISAWKTAISSSQKSGL